MTKKTNANKKITIKDVAKSAGVSIGTVSHVFNNYPDISLKTRARVKEIADQLHYFPSIVARSLTYKNQKTIALILNDMNIDRKVSISTDVISGVFRFCKETNAQFVFYATTLQGQREKSYDQFCEERNITGAVVQGLRTTDPYYHQMEKTDFPTVLIDMDNKNKQVGAISIDNQEAARQVTDFLITRGHRKIVFVNGNSNTYVSQRRLAGFKLALRQNSLPFDANFVITADFNEEIAYQKTKEFLAVHPDASAFFASSDLMALGILKAIRDLGKNVPEDISVFGFDNIALGEYLTPSLCSVEQDMGSIAYQAAALLNKLISRQEVKNKFLISNFELIIRDSVN
ncbi:LacI family DNA-binding transcriptional regulator [Oenococcus sicerae]|uniref:LacI family transcriptional regulator n=1 Tax=Oenococcus sicerae TaxID=2203724 RepID=A0AAJ1RA66_9LACO|nr:LacI family DNA-binding transcriptional regulator [Oenococcus sicerae]MDN6900948.1 LacI family transcriptional regulator [Oenococcus sicerae]